MKEWMQLGKQLRDFVNPGTFPVAVKLSEDVSELPEGARRPHRDLKAKMAPCQGSAMARRYGWTITFGPEDVGCATAAYTYGWDRDIDMAAAKNFFIRMSYACDEAAGSEILGGFKLLEMGSEVAVTYSPLERTKIVPDVVLVYANSAQMMRLIHGATHHTGKPLESQFSGRGGSCTDCVIGALLDDAPKIGVPGNGDRVWGACQDHELVMGIPASQLGRVVEGLEKTHRKGIRYPVPSYLRYTPEIGLAMPLADAFRGGA